MLKVTRRESDVEASPHDKKEGLLREDPGQTQALRRLSGTKNSKAAFCAGSKTTRGTSVGKELAVRNAKGSAHFTKPLLIFKKSHRYKPYKWREWTFARAKSLPSLDCIRNARLHMAPRLAYKQKTEPMEHRLQIPILHYHARHAMELQLNSKECKETQGRGKDDRLWFL